MTTSTSFDIKNKQQQFFRTQLFKNQLTAHSLQRAQSEQRDIQVSVTKASHERFVWPSCAVKATD